MPASAPPLASTEGKEQAGDPRRWVELRASRRLIPRLDLRELWDYRDVGLILAQRDLKIRYKQTFFGVAWALIQPLLAMVVFTVIFGRGLGVPSDGVPYAAFALAGLAVWFPFNTSLMAAAESLTRNPEMVTKVYFPRLMAPLAAVLAPAVDLAIAMVIAIAVALIVGVPPQLTTVLLPVCGAAVLLVAFAMGVWLASLNVLYRDVRYALAFLLQLLFFLSPVVYPSSVTDSGWQYVFALNPLVGVIDAVRWALLGVPAPSAGIILTSLGSALVILFTGLLFFQRAERQFADRI
jgi:homopolymeric O-antigen transport system permease protein